MTANSRYDKIMRQLALAANPDNVVGMARFGIRPKKAYGIAKPTLHQLAKEIGRDHALALKLWDSGIHEAQVLACLIADPKQVSEAQIERWVKDLDSWDLCDQLTGKLLDKTAFAYDKALEWSNRPEEFVKRAAFALMAWLAVHDKKVDDRYFLAFLALIKREAADQRNYVKKAINWALRQIGKRNLRLNATAKKTAANFGTSVSSIICAFMYILALSTAKNERAVIVLE